MPKSSDKDAKSLVEWLLSGIQKYQEKNIKQKFILRL